MKSPILFQLTKTERPLYDLSLGAMAYSYVEKFIKETLESLKDVKDINQYYPVSGNDDLKDAIRNHYDYPTEGSVFITNGAIHGLDLILRTLLRPGDEVLIPDPCFSAYFGLIEGVGGKISTYSIVLDTAGVSRLDLKELNEKITPRTRVLILNSPHNPSGHVMSESELFDVNEILKAHPEIYYVSDEVYSEIIFDGGKHHSLGQFNSHGFVVNSFSKSLGIQGLRIGWIYSRLKEEMASILHTLAFTCGGINSVGQELALTVLKKKFSALDIMEKNRQCALELLAEHLSPGDYTTAPGGLFILIKKEKIDLENKDVKVFDGSCFGQNIKDSIRVCFACETEEMKQGIKALLRVKQL